MTKAKTGWKVNWGSMWIAIAALVLVAVFALCSGCNGPQVLYGSEQAVELQKGEPAPEHGWLFSPAAWARIQETIVLQDAKIQELELRLSQEE